LYDYAIGILRLKKDDFYAMSWGEFNAICSGYIKKEQDRLRKLRMILAGQIGKDPREIIPLPHDYDHIPLRSKEEVEELARKFGVQSWIKGEA